MLSAKWWPFCLSLNVLIHLICIHFLCSDAIVQITGDLTKYGVEIECFQLNDIDIFQPHVPGDKISYRHYQRIHGFIATN